MSPLALLNLAFGFILPVLAETILSATNANVTCFDGSNTKQTYYMQNACLESTAIQLSACPQAADVKGSPIADMFSSAISLDDNNNQENCGKCVRIRHGKHDSTAKVLPILFFSSFCLASFINENMQPSQLGVSG